MSLKLYAATLALAASATFSQVSAAADVSDSHLAPATVVIYRADESVTTSRLNLDVGVDAMSIGRLSSEDAVVARGPAGEYTFGTNIPGSETLILDLKPGATYYLYTRVVLRGNRLQVAMDQVPERVARVQQPALESAIES